MCSELVISIRGGILPVTRSTSEYFLTQKDAEMNLTGGNQGLTTKKSVNRLACYCNSLHPTVGAMQKPTRVPKSCPKSMPMTFLP